MYKYEKGDCFNCCGGICTTGKYQNYCCPFVSLTKSKCPRYIPITPEMVKQWETFGYMTAPAPAWEGIGEPTKK